MFLELVQPMWRLRDRQARGATCRRRFRNARTRCLRKCRVHVDRELRPRVRIRKATNTATGRQTNSDHGEFALHRSTTMPTGMLTHAFSRLIRLFSALIVDAFVAPQPFPLQLSEQNEHTPLRPA